MPKYTLKAGEEKEVKTSALYLQIINATAEFIVKAPELGGELAGETSKRFELPRINQVWFLNPTNADIEIKYEVSNIRTEVADRGLVSIANEVVVKRIVEPQTFDAEVTTQASAPLVTDAFLAINDLTIPAGQVRKFASARANAGRKVIIQTITDDADLSLLRIGSSNALQANQGVYLQGNLDAVATYEIETESEVWIRNVGTKDAKIAGGEQWRA